MSTPSKWPLPKEGVRFLTPGFILSFLESSPITRDCFPSAMGFYPQAANHAMRRGQHDDNLLVFCTAGYGYLDCDHQTHRVGPGDLMLLPAGRPHAYRAEAGQPWTIYWVHFRGANADDFLQCLGYRDEQPVLHVDAAPGLISSFESLLAARNTGYSQLAFVNAANHLRHLITQFALAASRQHAARGPDLGLEAIHAYMRDNISRNLTLDELAKLANLSRFHFASRYRKLTGYSPIKHFMHMKMEAACRMLDSSNDSIKAVSADLGYLDALYFSRAFKSVVGMSPRAYRNSVRR